MVSWERAAVVWWLQCCSSGLLVFVLIAELGWQGNTTPPQSGYAVPPCTAVHNCSAAYWGLTSPTIANLHEFLQYSTCVFVEILISNKSSIKHLRCFTAICRWLLLMWLLPVMMSNAMQELYDAWRVPTHTAPTLRWPPHTTPDIHPSLIAHFLPAGLPHALATRHSQQVSFWSSKRYNNQGIYFQFTQADWTEAVLRYVLD